MPKVPKVIPDNVQRHHLRIKLAITWMEEHHPDVMRLIEEEAAKKFPYGKKKLELPESLQK